MEYILVALFILYLLAIIPNTDDSTTEESVPCPNGIPPCPPHIWTKDDNLKVICEKCKHYKDTVSG